jgi:hypothetical protein
MEKLFLYRTGLQAIKNYSHDQRLWQPFLDAILNGARNRDSDTSRDAIVLLSIIFAKNQQQLKSFGSLLPPFTIAKSTGGTTNAPNPYAQLDTKSDKKTTLLPCANPENVFARFYLVRICSEAVNPSEEDEQVDFGKFKTTLNYLLHDEELLVFFEAIKTASNKQFEYFLDKDVHQQNFILDFVVTRICSSLRKDKPQIQLHAACRAATFLSSSFAKYLTRVSPRNTDLVIVKNIMHRLYQRVEETGLGYDCGFVRLAAYKCLLWREESHELIMNRLKKEVLNNLAWMPFHLHGKYF